MSEHLLLDGRTVIVTGAGGGLGKCHAIELARHGASVVLNDVSADAAEAAAEEIRASGAQAIGVGGSVTDEAAVAAMVGAGRSRWGRIDGLVNNAGILRDRSFGKMTMADFREVLDVHLVGSAICTQAVWGLMREQGFGRIVMTTSSSGLFGNFGQANYAAAKMGMVGLMQTLAIEGKKYGIHVNCLAPTAATQMTDGVLSEEALSHLQPKLVSPAVAFLVSDKAPTRAIICAGGGHFAAANVSLSQGVYLGEGDDTALRLADRWDEVADREGALVPEYGFFQAEREIASAGCSAAPMAVAN